MADKNVLLHDTAGNDLYPKTKAANITDSINVSQLTGTLPVNKGGTNAASIGEKFIIVEAYTNKNGQQFQTSGRYEMQVTVPQGYRLLFISPIYTNGFVGAGYPLGFNPDTYLKTGTFGITVWMSAGGWGYISAECLCIKE